MAESRREIEEEELRDRLDIRNRNQATDRPERTKPDHLHTSQGPLSSIRAAIKRTRSTSQSDQGRDRRRPEITILSAEPLSSTAWFPGASGGFPTPPPIPASQTNWSGSITADPQPPPTYDQVIKEKTQEEDVAKPTAAPRRSTTIATQTDPVRDEDPAATGPECTAAAPQPITERNSAVKKLPKPQKPPRPSPPQPLQSGSASGTSLPKPIERASTSTSTDSPGGPPSAAAQQSPPEPSCPVPGSPHPSITVHWDVPVTPLSSAIDCPTSAVAPSLSPSDPTNIQRPTPLPRTKLRPQPIVAEVKVQTLVRLSENGVGESVTPGADTDEGSSRKYLDELLCVFCADDPCEPSVDSVEQSDRSGDSGDEMSSIHSQRNIRARIQAFESQVEDGIEDLAQPSEPQPRKAPFQAPPIAAKPSLAPRPSFKSSNQPNVTKANSYQDTLNTMFNTLSPTPAARPVPPRKPVELSLNDPEPETLYPTKVAVLPPARSSVLSRAKSFISQEDEEASGPPCVPLGRPAREPLKPNLNLNNHNSAYTDAERAAEDEYVDSPARPVPVKPQRNEGSLRRESLTRRPTTIRVPSQPSLYESQESPPALPTQRPVSVLSQSVGQKLNFVPRFPSQDSFFSATPEPALPPRPQGGKVLPARPPPAKAGPGRPPPPRANSSGRAASFHGTSRGLQPQQSRLLSQRTRRTGPILPPRPSPGHRLYNKYTLETPHAIASYDFNGSSTGELSFKKNEVLFILGQIDHQTFECQVGDRKGTVPESYVKVITPLPSPYSAQPAPRPAQQGSSGTAGSRRDSSCGLQVQALHDFDPEGPGELALRIGDVVSMVEEVDSEWYKGTSRGSSGFFPINYVKVLSNAPTPINEKKAKPPPSKVSGPRCVARFDFEGEHSDELSFFEGDVIQLKEYLGDDWVRGQLGPCTGIFPLNFVEVIEDLPPPPAQQKTLPTKIGLPGMATSPILQTGAKLAKPIQASPPAEEWAVALYDFCGDSEEDLSFQQGDRILVSQHLDADWCSGRLDGREGVFPVAFVETSIAPSPSVATPKGRGAGGLRAKALFDFQSNCDEELSFQVGDIIINMESIDGEWFLGELRGQRALVPKNYVQVFS